MYCYPFGFQMSYNPFVNPSSVDLITNSVQIIPNLQYCYNSGIIFGIQDFLPQGICQKNSQIQQLCYNESQNTTKSSKDIKIKNIKFAQKQRAEIYQSKFCSNSRPKLTQNIKKKNNNTLVEKASQQAFEQDDQCLQDINQNQQNENIGNYPKKNTQSNIVNQIFSFVSTQLKSQNLVKRYFKEDKKKVSSFYQILKTVKKRKKKYINRKYLGTLCTIKQNDIGYKMLLRATNKTNALSVLQFQKILTILIIYYLNKQSEISILTSKKINKMTFIEHLERRRQIKEYLAQKFQESLSNSKDHNLAEKNQFQLQN